MKKAMVLTLSVAVILFVAGCVGSNVNTQPYRQELVYVSWVSLSDADFNRDGSVAGKVGHHFVARIEFSIGWIDLRKTGGYASVLKEDIVKWAVTDPEYILFGDLPPGLKFNPTTGWIEGTPTAPGKWIITPGVRCKKLGNNVYNGNGYWYTYNFEYGYMEGNNLIKESVKKIWTVRSEAYKIEIKP